MPARPLSARLGARVAAVATIAAAGLGVASTAAPTANAAPVAPAVAVRAAALPGSPVVDATSSSAQIRALQRLLTTRGFATAVDGSFGPNTKSQVIAFQKSRGLSPDGVAGPATLGALVTTVREGDRNGYVAALQEALKGKGYSLTVDSSFGPATKNAVVAFQKSRGLTQDGIVGPATWSALLTKSSTPPPTTSCDNVRSGVPQSATVLVAPGFRVHKCFESRMRGLLAAAKRDGITLGSNSSWRSPEQQIALRKAHCGTSYYAIYQMPASQCTPPTAIPGYSRHERGLAIDFSNSSTRSTRVFKWLAVNGPKYHFHNLPSEPWHWSWDGH